MAAAAVAAPFVAPPPTPGSFGMNGVEGSWGCLWDQAGAVSDHTQRGIDFLEKYAQFVKERSIIEDEYALKLRNLVKKSGGKKKEDEEWKSFSYYNTFHAILREMDSLAAQHETISDKLKKEINPAVLQKCQDMRLGRKKHMNELLALNNALQAQVDNMYKMQKGYVKAFKDAETACLKFDKAEHNMDLSRAEVERARANLVQKNQACDLSKQAYGSSLEIANHVQNEHYNIKIPHLLEQMRLLDVERIRETKNAMAQTVDVETAVQKVVQRCYDDMKSAIAVIDPEKDTHIVVELKKTGYAHPPDFAFVDLGNPGQILQGNGESVADSAMATATLKRNQIPATNGKGITRKHSMHQRLFGSSNGQNGKSNGQIGDYGNLPPQQRCRKIESKIQELSKEIATREHSKDALIRMRDVYTDNPKLGNASDVDQQLKEFKKEIDHLQEQVNRYRRLLADAQHELNMPLAPQVNGTNGTSSPRVNSAASLTPLQQQHSYNKRTSYSEDSVSSDGSTVMGIPRRLNGGPNNSHGTSTASSNSHHIPHIDSSAETASNSNGSHKNLPTSSNTSAAGGDYYEDPDENLQPLGTCKALYAFEGASGDGTTICMQAGEQLFLLEKDDGQGDGWTRVRHPQSGHEGFVPSAYLECHWY